MTSDADMPQYDGMGYEELVSSAQFLWLENAKLREEIGRWITLPEYPMVEFKPRKPSVRTSSCETASTNMEL